MRTSRRSARAAWLMYVCAAALIAGFPRCHAQDSAPASQTAGRRDASIDEYRNHLEELTAIEQACAKARDAKSCDPALVGQDDRVLLSSGERRLVRYDWLRALLVSAQEKDQPAAKPEAKGASRTDSAGVMLAKLTTTELLQNAEARLARDRAQVDAPFTPALGHAQERGELNKVLAGREFRNLEEPSTRDTIMERAGNAINRFFDRVARFSARSPWIGQVVKWGFFGAICVALVFGLIQLERRWRVRLVPEQDAPAPGAASARDWQLWLADARKAAAEDRWREAVHFVYWASISRLESKRLWPADRARTPREYLALVAQDDPRKAGLATLTGSFERIWYGGRDAGEGDYRAAEQTATALISSGGAA